MTLTEGGVQGIALQVSQSLSDLIQVKFRDLTDEGRYNDVAHILETMSNEVKGRIDRDQFPGDPTKADGPPPVPTDDGETPPPPPP